MIQSISTDNWLELILTGQHLINCHFYTWSFLRQVTELELGLAVVPNRRVRTEEGLSLKHLQLYECKNAFRNSKLLLFGLRNSHDFPFVRRCKICRSCAKYIRWQDPDLEVTSLILNCQLDVSSNWNTSGLRIHQLWASNQLGNSFSLVEMGFKHFVLE